MPEQHVMFMQQMGVAPEVIDQIEKLTPDQMAILKGTDEEAKKPITAILGNATKAVQSAIEGTLLNNQEFLNKIPEEKIPETVRKKYEAGQYTRFQNEILETAKKELGLEDTDLADMTDEQKKSIRKMVAFVGEKHLGKKGNVKGLQDMQRTVTDLQTKLDNANTEWQTKLDNKVKETTGDLSVKMTKSLVRGELAALEGIELNVPASYLVDNVLSKLNAKYAVVLDENMNLDIKQKDNVALDVMDNNKKVTFQQALTQIVIDDKVGKPKKVEEGQEGGDGYNSKKFVIGGKEGQDAIEVPSYISTKIADNQKLENQK